MKYFNEGRRREKERERERERESERKIGVKEDQV